VAQAAYVGSDQNRTREAVAPGLKRFPQRFRVRGHQLDEDAAGRRRELVAAVSDAAEPTDEDIDAFYRAMAEDDEAVWESDHNHYLWARSIAGSAEATAVLVEALQAVHGG
jgi:hypothetical protein